MAIVSSIRGVSRSKVYLFLDIALALAFVAELEEHFVGLRNHELIGVGLGAALLVHILLHWRWLLSITRTFLHKLLHESRLNYALALVLFVDLGVTIVTGILISRTLGLNFNIGGSWERIHVVAADFSLLLVALHVALHWKWIASHAKKYLFGFIRLPRRQPKPVAVIVRSHRPVSYPEV